MNRDLMLRAGVVLLAAIATLDELPWPVTTVLTGAALFVVAQRLVTVRRRGGLDALLVGTGGTLIALMLTGLALSLVGLRLQAGSWVIALTVEALIALVVLERWKPLAEEPIPPPEPGVQPVGRRAGTVLGGWIGASTAVLVLALGLSWWATDRDTVAPVQISAGPVAGGAGPVTISAQQPTAALQLRVRTDETGSTREYPVAAVAADSSVLVTVDLPAGRTVITLNNPGQTQPLRTLIVER